MPSLYNWNKSSLGTYSLFNRKSMYRATLQGGVFLSMFLGVSQALTHPRANIGEVSKAFSCLFFTYGALGEKPLLWAVLLSLVAGSGERRHDAPSTFSYGLKLSIATLAILGMIIPCCFSQNEEFNSDVGPDLDSDAGSSIPQKK